MSTLYSQVCDQILDRIKNGALKVGDRLPPEAEYAAELGVSRSTLRLAFSELEASGVLQRRKRAGTEIISDKPKQRFNMATTGINELLSLGRDTRLTIDGTRTVQTGDIPQLEGHRSETGHWLEVSGARTMAGEQTPFSVNRVYVPARFAGIEPILKATDTSVFRAIEDTFNVSVGRVSQTMRAISCPAAEAELMGLREGAPVLQIEAQLFLRDGTLMEVSLATFDPDRFQVRTDVQID
ncbi:MAG: GntR family transcriptional regulator [Stappiaceae bacterium]